MKIQIIKYFSLFFLFCMTNLFGLNGRFVFYTGFIGKYPVEMTFYSSESSKEISGFYRYIKSNGMLDIKGQFEDSINFRVSEKTTNFNTGKSKTTGYFSGKIVRDSIIGKWVSRNFADTLGFILVKSFGNTGVNLEEGHVYSRDSFKNDTGKIVKGGRCALDFLRIDFIDTIVEEKLNQSIYQYLLPFDFKGEIKHPEIAKYPDYKSLAHNFTINVRKAVISNDPFVSECTWEWEGYSRLVWNGSGVLSIAFDDFSYLGGVHSNWHTFYHNYNLTTGKEIKIEEIFVRGYQRQLQTLITDHTINKEKLDPVYQDSVPLNTNFYLTPSGIGFFYNNYEIACFMSGSTESFISWKEINKWIDPKGPMAWVKQKAQL